MLRTNAIRQVNRWNVPHERFSGSLVRASQVKRSAFFSRLALGAVMFGAAGCGMIPKVSSPDSPVERDQLARQIETQGYFARPESVFREEIRFTQAELDREGSDAVPWFKRSILFPIANTFESIGYGTERGMAKVPSEWRPLAFLVVFPANVAGAVPEAAVQLLGLVPMLFDGRAIAKPIFGTPPERIVARAGDGEGPYYVVPPELRADFAQRVREGADLGHFNPEFWGAFEKKQKAQEENPDAPIFASDPGWLKDPLSPFQIVFNNVLYQPFRGVGDTLRYDFQDSPRAAWNPVTLAVWGALDIAVPLAGNWAVTVPYAPFDLLGLDSFREAPLSPTIKYYVPEASSRVSTQKGPAPLPPRQPIYVQPPVNSQPARTNQPGQKYPPWPKWDGK